MHCPLPARNTDKGVDIAIFSFLAPHMVIAPGFALATMYLLTMHVGAVPSFS